MEELINLIKSTKNGEIIPNINTYNSNDVFTCLLNESRYDLFISNNIRIDFTSPNYQELLNLLLSDEDYGWYLKQNNYAFTSEETDKVWEYFIANLRLNSRELYNFSYIFFNSIKETDDFIKRHHDYLTELLSSNTETSEFRCFGNSEEFIKIVLTTHSFHLLGDITKYPISCLKLYAKVAKQAREESHYGFNELVYLQNILTQNAEFTYEEVYNLMSILGETIEYKKHKSNVNPLNDLVSNHLDYLIDLSEHTGIPKCLTGSEPFITECLKRNKMSLAVNCLFPPSIAQNPDLVTKYCQELNLPENVFYERIKWLYSYYEINSNIFNTFLPIMLKDPLFSLNKDHYERLINDVEVEMHIAKLSPKEQEIFCFLANKFSYGSFDITPMIVSIIDNISNYPDLINSITDYNLTDQQINNLIIILSSPTNYYEVTSISELNDIATLKKSRFARVPETSSVESKQTDILKYLFNIDIKEASRINWLYCYDEQGKNILHLLKSSELPKNVYDMLYLLNQIVDSPTEETLNSLHNSIKDIPVYNRCIPFESYLRSVYTELYSKSLYKVAEQENLASDVEKKVVSNNGRNVNVYIPRSNFRLFVHCIGTCTINADKLDANNYQRDWEHRPQMQDHFVACSYIDQSKLLSLRSNGEIIMGFDSLEGSAIYGMGNTDIDSIGTYAKSYNGSANLMNQGSRAKYSVPSLMLEKTTSYNEFVIERRNVTDKTSIKRKPSYIIMSVDAIENSDNFADINDLLNNVLDMLSDEERQAIKDSDDSNSIRRIISNHVKELISKYHLESLSEKEVINEYCNKINKAKYYNECLRAAEEFDIPIIILDQLYYLKKMLNEKDIYDEDTKVIIIKNFMEANIYDKQRIYSGVDKNLPFSELFPPPKETKGTFTITV